MSTSTSACYDFAARKHRHSSRKALRYNLFGSAAVSCLVLACSWTVYSNIFAASVYPQLNSANFDAPVVRRSPALAIRSASLGARDSLAARFQPAPVVSSPAAAPVVSPAATVSPGPSLSFNDRFAAAEPQSVEPAPQDVSAPPAERQVAEIVPLPAPRPTAPRLSQSARELAQGAKAAVLASVAPPEKPNIFERLFGKLQSPGATLAYASADVGSTSSLGQGQNNALGGSLPRYDRTTAVYDISAHMVYMPDGTKLEAHSGLGSRLDDPRYVRERMYGPTPPHLYDLEPREALFHGVPALRLKPIGGEEAIFGRSGLLAHTYMLGPNGDSNGCVSFKNYQAFLQAYRNGEIKRLAVVARLE